MREPGPRSNTPAAVWGGPTLRLLLGAILMAGLCALTPAAAHAPSDAPKLRPDIVSMALDPPAPAPHQQFAFTLTLTADSPVIAAAFQVCEVGKACFAPPRPAMPIPPSNGNGMSWRGTTEGYAPAPIDLQGGERIGIQWILTELSGRGNTTMARFPAANATATTGPADMGTVAGPGAEDDYFVTTIGPGARSAPGPGALAAGTLVAAAAGMRRRA